MDIAGKTHVNRIASPHRACFRDNSLKATSAEQPAQWSTTARTLRCREYALLPALMRRFQTYVSNQATPYEP